MDRAGDVETWTQRYGREIFSRLAAVAVVPFSPAWLDDRLMEVGMTEEAVKVQLFRFVDVLPRLSTPADIARHLREYFVQTDGKLPRWLQSGLKMLPSQGLAARLLAATANTASRRMARKFIAGTNVAEVLAAVARLRHRSLAFTVDLLGEATITEKEADASRAQYLKLIAGLSTAVNSRPAIDLIDRDDQHELPRVNVSVKLSALYSQFDPIDPEGTSAAVRQRLRPILQSARQRRAFVNIDMEQYAFKDLTLRIFRQVLEEPAFRNWPDVGIAVQAYLHDTERDLRQLADWAKQRGTAVWVRLVKGAYWDYETILARQSGWPTPVFDHKHETDANYERLTEFLLLNRHWLRPAFGSHNVRSVAHALALARVLDLPPRSFELQMLYGMADPIKDVLAGMGQRVRVYTPFGELLPGMAYLVRRLLENTANESFSGPAFPNICPLNGCCKSPPRRTFLRMEDDA